MPFGPFVARMLCLLRGVGLDPGRTTDHCQLGWGGVPYRTVELAGLAVDYWLHFSCDVGR